jgi:hypothetical protein
MLNESESTSKDLWLHGFYRIHSPLKPNDALTFIVFSIGLYGSKPVVVSLNNRPSGQFPTIVRMSHGPLVYSHLPVDGVFPAAKAASGEDFRNDFAGNVCEAMVATLVAENEPLVVQT